ncbi:DUF6098 family protein [Streptomyces rochei]
MPPRAYVRLRRGAGDRCAVRAPPGSPPRLPGTPSACWADRPVRVWAARRLHDYAHLPHAHDKGPGVRPWVLTGREAGRGPDNEPLVTDARPLCWIAPDVIEEAREEVERQERPWGPLRRAGR